MYKLGWRLYLRNIITTITHLSCVTKSVKHKLLQQNLYECIFLTTGEYYFVDFLDFAVHCEYFILMTRWKWESDRVLSINYCLSTVLVCGLCDFGCFIRCVQTWKLFIWYRTTTSSMRAKGLLRQFSDEMYWVCR